ncbi:cytochrome P450 [Mycena sp. CBHHK59/15]|nr:cytochrome P450 [Mycena sp. CBHHK59/15]
MDDIDCWILLASLWPVYTITLLLTAWAAFVGGLYWRRKLHTTGLHGPTEKPYIGTTGAFTDSMDTSESCRQYALKYGPVFQVPTGMLLSRIVICDSAAIAHFYANAPAIYRTPGSARRITENLVGHGLLWVDGEHHLKLPSESPFSDSSVKAFTSAFFNMAYKMINMWNRKLESRPHGVVIEAQHWMNSVILDTLGTSGFSHDFESLNRDYCTVTAAFNALRAPTTSCLSDLISRFGSSFHILCNIPTAKHRVLTNFCTYMSQIAEKVLERSGKEAKDDSVVGLLTESPDGEFRLSHEEVLAQCEFHFLSSKIIDMVSDQWLLVELAKDLSIQETLTKELQQVDDYLTHTEICTLPYLNAVVLETLRLHPPIGETTRVAIEDDVIPLSSPIIIRSGETVTSINIAKRCMNTSEPFWGLGCLEFDPRRWFQGVNTNNFPRNSHLAFRDGPRTCLGRGFAMALIKVVVCVIIRNFTLALPEGPQSIIQSTGGYIPRPRICGQGSEVLIVVRKRNRG